MPMRDGARLSTDVIFPRGARGKLGTVLIRTPYDKDTGEIMVFAQGLDAFLSHGFAVVLQSERGRGFSEGIYHDYLQGASTDGADTLDWIVRQEWSNGRVGSAGCSSSAETQWPMAAGNHPAHAAMITAGDGSAVGDIPDNDTRGAFFRGGVPRLGLFAQWYTDFVPSERLSLPPDSTVEQRRRLRESYTSVPRALITDPDTESIRVDIAKHLPSQDIARAVGGALNPFDRYITWGPADPRWRTVEMIGAGAHPHVPTLHVGTWHDPYVGETVRLFKYLQDSKTPNQYLIIGAGAHCSNMMEPLANLNVAELKHSRYATNQRISDLKDIPNFSAMQVGDFFVGDTRFEGSDHGWTDLFLNWFDFWLGGSPHSLPEMPRVRLYIAGEGWRSGNQWPLEETQIRRYFLASNERSAGRPSTDTGTLSLARQVRETKETYRYDPTDPTPSLGGDASYAAAKDQRPVESRRDVLVFSTPPLEHPLTIAGPVSVLLSISSSAKDTDFIVKLVDVSPDGTAINLSDDAFRVRYREGFDRTTVMHPHQIYTIKLSNMVTAVRFAAGHRVRLDISSSSFPEYERNLNTGGNNYDETNGVIAENQIHMGSLHPSYVDLPVLPNH